MLKIFDVGKKSIGLFEGDLDITELKKKFCLEYCVHHGRRLIETQGHTMPRSVFAQEGSNLVSPFTPKMRLSQRSLDSAQGRRLKAELDYCISRLQCPSVAEKSTPPKPPLKKRNFKMVKASRFSLGGDIIARPAHYIEGRIFEPITVIEEYGVCHRLACVVKYIARAGRKTSFLNDLLKAHWYLGREIKRCVSFPGPCVSHWGAEPSFSVQEILEDWKLRAYLEATLSYILAARLALKPHCNRKDIQTYSSSLIKAIGHLESAIEEAEEENPQ
jgi:hypothetical protein